ncbi:MAG: 7-carboxy-7-deazaguanine synthase QueE [Methanobacteriaceae archaeon]
MSNTANNTNINNNNSDSSQAPVIEIFSSIQGEGILVGRRQIFVRFAGCNLDCNYCDTSSSKNINAGNIMSIEDVLNKINELATPDLHSISFTGGEPLIHAEFISKVIANFDKLGYKSFLETNGTLPNQLKFLKNIDYVSMDIKLVEHFKNNNDKNNKNNNGNFSDSNSNDYKETFNFWKNNIFKNELASIKILIEWSTNIYCKLVVSPKTKISEIEDIAIRVSEIILNSGNNRNDGNTRNNIINVPMVIQPLSPIEQWHSDTSDNASNNLSQNKLLEISSVVGKYMEVLTIPQLHKVLDIE